tara:strand:- start:383 stop:1465 length:1083 start_codon:yes stop_codon:yes gene_type:complete
MWNREQANKLKSKYQTEVRLLSIKYNDLFIAWCTGAGKSKAAIDILSSSKEHWYIVCKETTHIQNWIEEFKSHGKEKFLESQVTLFCYDSLHKYEHTTANLILDEIHCITHKRLNSLKTIKANRVLALTATLPIDKQIILGQLKRNFFKHTITINKAIEEGILPFPTVYKVYVDFDTELQRKEYQVLDKKVQSLINLLEGQYNEGIKNKMLNLASKRKRLLGESKTKSLQELLKRTSENKRFVCFTNTIEQCDNIGTTVIHSKISKNQIEDSIEKFNNLKLNSLFAVNMLKESINMKDIDVGYLTQLDNQVKSFIQVLGRVFRANDPKLYVLILKNTRDEKFMETAFKGIDSKYVKEYKL